MNKDEVKKVEIKLIEIASLIILVGVIVWLFLRK